MKPSVLLSMGSIPWKNLSTAANFVESLGFDGLEFLPFRRISHVILRTQSKNPENWVKNIAGLSSIKHIHHAWRLDLHREKRPDVSSSLEYYLHSALRFFLFPENSHARSAIALISKELDIPVTVHDISPFWTTDTAGVEFQGGITLEIPGSEFPHKIDTIKSWLSKKNHFLLMDTRDDQSYAYARLHGYTSWETFWETLGIEKIKNIQLTLIGNNGLNEISTHQETLAEKQFRFLKKRDWNGSVTIEVNPLLFFTLRQRNVTNTLRLLLSFVQTTLLSGERWSVNS